MPIFFLELFLISQWALNSKEECIVKMLFVMVDWQDLTSLSWLLLGYKHLMIDNREKD